MSEINRLAGAESALKLAGAKVPKGGNVLYAEADDLNALKRYLKKRRWRLAQYARCQTKRVR